MILISLTMNLVVFQLVFSSDREGNRIFNNHSFYLYLDEDPIRRETDSVNVNILKSAEFTRETPIRGTAPYHFSPDSHDHAYQNLDSSARSELIVHETDTFSEKDICHLTVD